MKFTIKSLVVGLAFGVACIANAAVDGLSHRSSAAAAQIAGGGDSSAPIISADGRYVVFASSAANLVTNQTGQSGPAKMNVFVRDRSTQQTALASVNVNGTGGGNGDSYPTDISTDGRYVLFESSATNLVARDTNNATDVFMRDMVAGTTLLVSTGVNGGFCNGPSKTPVMTPDGRYVAFVSSANNLVANDTNGLADVFVRDMQLSNTVMASVGATVVDATSRSASPLISPDGRFVAFFSTAKNLVPGITTQGEIYLRDLVISKTYLASTNARTLATSLLGSNTGMMCGNHVLSDDGQFVTYAIGRAGSRSLIVRCQVTNGTTAVVSTNGMWMPDYENWRNLDMTPDGRFVTFVGDTNGGFGPRGGVYLWDGQTGVRTLVSADLNGATNSGVCDWPTIDPTGRYVLFLSNGTNLALQESLSVGLGWYLRDTMSATTTLVSPYLTTIEAVTTATMTTNAQVIAYDAYIDAGFSIGQADVYVRDLSSNTNELISVGAAGLPSNTPTGTSSITSSCLSSNGRYFVFSSRADDLVPNDFNGCRDVFVQDRVLGVNILVSVDTNSVAGVYGPSFDPSISGDGRFVAFTSMTTSLDANVIDTNGTSDVFVRDLVAGKTTLVSVSTDGTTAGNGASSSASISGDGRFIVFHSLASNLVPGVSGGHDNLFIRDVVAGSTVALTTNGGTGWYATAMTDGRYLAFTLTGGGSSAVLYDLVNSNVVWTGPASSSGASGIAVSADLSHVAITTNTYGFAVFNVTNGFVQTVAFNAKSPLIRFSGDGRFLAYVNSDIYLYDTMADMSTNISRSYTGGSANGISGSPDISFDGRFVAYVSLASNLVTNDNNNTQDVFIYDQTKDFTNGATRLVSASRLDGAAANGLSMTPYFSADGRTLAFESCAGDLVSLDFNQTGDVFAYNVATLATVDPGAPVLVFDTPVTFSGGVTGGGGVTFSWSVNPTHVYTVEYKDDLNDPQWHEFAGVTSVIGNTQYAEDVAGASQRFYRVVMAN